MSIYGFCKGNSADAVTEYQQRFPEGLIPNKRTFHAGHRHLRDTNMFTSTSGSDRPGKEKYGNDLEMIQRGTRIISVRLAVP
jgi:hypothetical protein